MICVQCYGTSKEDHLLIEVCLNKDFTKYAALMYHVDARDEIKYEKLDHLPKVRQVIV